MASVTDLFNWFANQKTNESSNQESYNQESSNNHPTYFTRNVYTYSNEPTPLQKRGEENSVAYKHHSFSPFTPTPTLQQGAEFKKYQGRIQKGVEKKTPFITEGFGTIGSNSMGEINNDALINEFNVVFIQYQEMKMKMNEGNQVNEELYNQLEDRLNLLTSQLNNQTRQTSTQYLNNIMKVKETEPVFNNYVDEYNSVNTKIQNYQENKNIENILKESDLLIVHKHYRYLLYSVLLIGTAIVGMRIINTQ